VVYRGRVSDLFIYLLILSSITRLFSSPDGWQYPQNSTKLAGDLITELDPYHPVSLVLNCYDYFFEEYSQGASIIMQVGFNCGRHRFQDTDDVSSLRIPIQSISMRRSVLFLEHHVMPLWEIAVATTVPDRS
jgi:hypothetical protein